MREQLSSAWRGFIFTKEPAAGGRKGGSKLDVAQDTYIWRSIFLDSLYLRSRRLRIRILLIQVTFSGMRALAVPFLLPREGKRGGNEAELLPAAQHAFAEAFNPLYFRKKTINVQIVRF